MTDDTLFNISVKTKPEKKSGFELEQQEDGFYYIAKVPKNCTTIGVGDRVLEINGIMHTDFKTQKKANGLLDTIRLEVIPMDSDDDSEEDDSDDEDEEVSRLREKTGLAAAVGREDVDGGEDDGKSSGGRSKSSSKSIDSDDDEDWDDDAENVIDDELNKDGSDDEEGADDDSSASDGDGEVVNQISQKDQEARDLVKANAAKRNANSDLEKEKQSWKERPDTKKYQPNERFMINCTKKEDDDDDNLGIDLVEFKQGKGKRVKIELFVRVVDRGPFFETALDRGDKIMTINGKKVPEHIDSAEKAMDLIHSKPKISLYVMRPSAKDKGYKWLMENIEKE